jgi:hypothetical protein
MHEGNNIGIMTTLKKPTPKSPVPPCATRSHLPAVRPSTRPAMLPGRLSAAPQVQGRKHRLRSEG